MCHGMMTFVCFPFELHLSLPVATLDPQPGQFEHMKLVRVVQETAQIPQEYEKVPAFKTDINRRNSSRPTEDNPCGHVVRVFQVLISRIAWRCLAMILTHTHHLLVQYYCCCLITFDMWHGATSPSFLFGDPAEHLPRDLLEKLRCRFLQIFPPSF
jgi:hypothetical protein